MELNDIAVRPAKRQVRPGDGTKYSYGSASSPAKDQSIRRAVVLRARHISNPGNLLSTAVSTGFHSLLRDFDSVFNPNFPGYNGAVYSFQAKVNMVPVEPPQRKWSCTSTCS